MPVNPNTSDELFDVVIIGAGAAGITIALQLGQAGIKTALIEGGGYGYTPESQALYEGFNEGYTYPLESYRLRYFGGTTNHWQGWCRPLDPANFIARPDIDYPGWAIDGEELAPYLEPALRLVEIAPDVIWEPPAAAQTSRFNQGLAKAGFKEVYWHWSPPTHFGEKYLPQLEENDNITILVNNSLVDFEFTAEGEITGAVLHNLKVDEKQTVCGKVFVLACGGVENARLLLHVNDRHDTDLGNRSGQLGKNFMEHPHFFNAGQMILFDRQYEHVTSGGRFAYRFFCPTDALTEQEGILPASLRMRIFETPEERLRFVNELSTVSSLAGEADWQAGNLDIVSEQMPTAQNTITLSDEVDALGIGKPILTWGLDELDYHSLRRILIQFAKFLIYANLGRCKLKPWVLSDRTTYAPAGGGHHIGTTRMGQTASEGVVDTDCKLYGTNNLYIAGSSVFPTGGYANPTLTIVQLALRLSDHLKDRLR